MGGPGSGYGIKRPDHPTGAMRKGLPGNKLSAQIKHQKSVFSDLPDPSCHAHKRERDRLNGIKDYEMSAERRKLIGLTYKEMQDLACQHASEMMQVLLDVAKDPDSPVSAKVAAANSWLDRAFGKAASTNFNVNANINAKPSELSDADLSRRVEAALRIEDTKRRTPETIEGEAKPINLREYN